MSKWPGGRLGASNNPTTSSRSGIWDLSEQIVNKKEGSWPFVLPNGLTASRAANSAVQLKEIFPNYQSGVYWININGTPKEVYCDMSSDNGGWMLYSSFSSDNSLSAETAPAINGNRILHSQLGTFGYSLNYTTSYHDGVTDTLGYVRRPEFYAHYYSGSPNGELSMTSWNGPSSVTQLRVLHGTGATQASYNSGGSRLITNNVTRVEYSDSYTTRTDVIGFNPAGASPLFKQVEFGIAGISWVYVR